MKLFLLFCLLVQTNAFRVPLPYGTGIASSDMGDQGIFHRIYTWLADDKSLPGKIVNFMYKHVTLFENYSKCRI